MIKRTYNMDGMKPFTRETAAEIAIAASHYESTFTMESGNSIINMKSMLGLLSHSILRGDVTLVADGADEEAAMHIVCQLMEKHRQAE